MEQEFDRQQRAVVYVRVASPHGDYSTTAQHQREGCLRIAAQNGLSVVREYIDSGRPARLDQQVELQRLLADLEAQRDAAFVVIWNYARLGHDLAQLDDVTRRIRACGAEIITITGMPAVERYLQERRNQE